MPKLRGTLARDGEPTCSVSLKPKRHAKPRRWPWLTKTASSGSPRRALQRCSDAMQRSSDSDISKKEITEINETSNTNQRPPMNTSRRQVLCLAGAGVGLALGHSLPAAAHFPQPARILKRGDKIDVGDKPDAIVQKAYELGYEYEKKHGGCARCTVAALQDAIPFVAVDEGLFRGSTCLDGGATPTSIQNCGAFTGAGMVIGYVCGSTRGKTFKGSAALAHELLHKVYYRFKEKYGTVLCKDVKKGAKGNCPEVVGRAAKWTAEVLLTEFTDYTAKEQPDHKPQGKDGTETKAGSAAATRPCFACHC